ncbi:MAG: hypothetical protein QM831_01355 [Kofleriaceae bacterium]
MRNAIALVVLGACAASTAELNTAKTARYKVDGAQLLQMSEQAAADKNYKIGAVDDGHLQYETVPKWYSAEGDLETAGADDYTTIRPHSVRVSFVVQISQADSNDFVVTVTPHTWQFVGTPQLRPLEPADPNLPPWVKGRADALNLAIYDVAKGYVVAAK